MIFINKKYLLFIIIILFLSCKTETKYIVKPLTTPPNKYYISDYKTKKELYYEYQNALMTIKEWQGWYNINAGSNFYNYKDITNIDYNEITNMLSNNIMITNGYLIISNEGANTNGRF